jgi:dethiobiotin synthetase
MAAFFVTGTGTDVGKTFVCCGIIRAFRLRKKPVAAIKPIYSGFDPKNFAESDPGLLLKALGRTVTLEEIARITPWRFEAAMAPDMAARKEGREVDFEGVLDFCKRAIKEHAGTLLIEGAGGIMVPISGRDTFVDLITELETPAVLVTGSYLGALSHTLTCMDVLAQQRIKIAAIVVSETKDSSVPLPDTVDTIARFAERTSIVPLPRLSARDADHPAFGEIADLLGG